MRKSVKALTTAVLAGSMVFAIGTTAIPNTAVAATDPCKEAIKLGKKPFDENGEYNAYFMFQADGCWVFRDPYYDKNLGFTSKNFNKMLTSLDLDVPKPVAGDITDVKIKGNGTYTVSVKGLNGAVTNDSGTHVKYVGVSTDIPKNDKVKITNVQTKIDGSTKLSQDNAIIDEEALQSPKTISFNCTNTYRNEAELKKELPIPKDSVEITFTVSGFAKDNPDAVAATEKPLKIGKPHKKSDDSSKTSVPVVAGIAVAVIVVVAGVVVVLRKKKK